MLHCTNGDSVVQGLTAAGVPGPIVTAADVLHEGPCVAGLTSVAWRSRRAAFLADDDPELQASIEAGMAARDAALGAAAAAGDSIVLWFEHDLFDQLNLVWLIDALAARQVSPAAVSLVVIDQHPHVERFHGLGQLSPADLAALFPQRAPASDAMFIAARRAWTAVCDTTPLALISELPLPHPGLPFLSAALERLLEELPGTSDGLSRVERQGLRAVGSGASTFGDAFVANAALEEAVFLGDSSFYRTMDRLASAERPLLTLGGPPGPPGHRTPVSLTDTGRAVLAGEADHAALNGLDRWVGGIHLEGRSPAWRWDAASRLVARSPLRG